MNAHLPPELLPLLGERLGWALLHSLWQGALIAAALAVALPFLRSATARHAACLLALLAPVAAVAITFARHRPDSDVGHLPAPMPTSAETQIVAASPSASLPSATTAAPLAPSPTPSSWRARLDPTLPWVSAVWLAGVALLSLRHCIGWQRMHAMRRSGVAARPELQRTFAGLLEKFGCTVGAPLLESAHVAVPMLAGLVKPAVLLPLRVVTGLRACEIEAILAHELAHLVRHDAWSNLAQVAIETLLFYHPAVWWIGHRARQERENAADDLALEVCADRRVYAGALAQLAEWDCASSAALAATGGSLLARIQRIVRPERGEAPAAGWSLCLPPLLAALALALTTLFHAEAQTPNPAVTTEHDPAKSEALAKPGVNGGLKGSARGATVVSESSAATSSAKPETSRNANDTMRREHTPEEKALFAEAMRLEIKSLKSTLAKPGLGDAYRQSVERALARLEAERLGIMPTDVAKDSAAKFGQELEALKTEVEAGKRNWEAFKAGLDPTGLAEAKELEAKVLRAQALFERLAASASGTAMAPEINRQAARRRAADDQPHYSLWQLQEIEALYQVANKNWRTPEARESLKKLLEKYDRANRTGCATLYLGQMSEGQERLDYLTRAVEKFSDCYYLDGCQVGGYGRYVLAIALWEKGEKEKARALLGELRTRYADTTDHRDQPMTAAADALLNKWATEP